MSGMNSVKANDDNLINLLMEETYQSISGDENEKTPDEILNHYNKHQDSAPDLSFENYIEEKNTQLYELQYQFETSCFQFQTEEMILDFPSNWSYFTSIKNALDLEVLCLCEVAAGSDDAFYEVLSDTFFQKRPSLLAHSKGKVYFVCFQEKADMVECLDLYNGQVNVSEEKQAA